MARLHDPPIRNKNPACFRRQREEAVLCGKNRKVDGFDEANNTVYEFQGCVWHGCPKCYSPDTINKHSQIPMKEL